MRLLRAVADLLFPPVCQVCREPGEFPLCLRCLASFRLIAPPVCQKCGRPVRRSPNLVFTCISCRHRRLYFSCARSAGVYDGPLREAIHVLKFDRCRAMAEPLVQLMAAVASREFSSLDAIVPVPLHPSRFRERGFNQSELLAVGVGRALRLSVGAHVLRRGRPTGAQSGLALRDRRENVRGAFEPRAELKGMRVLLVDDVLSTGFTASECALALRRAGAAAVYVIAAAMALPDG